MRGVVVGVLGLAACGRLGFDPVGNDSAPTNDGAPANDGVGPTIDAMIDAPPAACASAILIPLGRTGPTSTCTHPDKLDSCAAAAKQEVVFKFIAPASASYTFSAKDPGTMNISNSTQILDPSCNLLPGCSGLTGRSFTAGQVVYFVVEAAGAPACAMIEFEITSP